MSGYNQYAALDNSTVSISASQGETDWNNFLGKCMNLLVVIFLGGGTIAAFISIIVMQAKKKT